MSDRQTLGLLATYRSGLTSLRSTGQDDRFVQQYLARYAKHFDKIYYFSYLSERGEDFISDHALLKKVTVLPKRWAIPSLVYGLLLPFAYPKEFSECAVFRVFQALGILPLLTPVAWGKQALVTYGYRYAEFARIEKKSFLKVLLLEALEYFAIRRASVLLVTTLELFQYLQPKRGNRPVVLIPNGVDPEQFSPSQAPENAPIQKLLFVGRLERQKNLENLLRAAAELPLAKSLRWIWVGEGTLKSSLEKLAKDLDIPIEIRKPVPYGELANCMRDADAFTLVSYKEGHPKVLIEAMSAGLPCLVTPCDGNRTLIQDRQNGIVCEGFEANQLKEGLLRLLTNPVQSRQLGKSARETIVRSYDLRRWIEAECALLKCLSIGPAEGWQWTSGKKGSFLSRWLDYSVRRERLDRDLWSLLPLFQGRTLEIGGGTGPQRGRFVRPWWQTTSWEILNRDPRAKPHHLADIEDANLPAQSFDTVLALEMLEYTTDPDNALRAMSNVLKPNGKLILSIPYSHSPDQSYDRWRFQEKELKKRFEKAGLQVIQIQPQGGFCASLAHRIKSLASRRSNVFWRWAIGVFVAPFVGFLNGIDSVFQKASILRSWPTGYLALAVKPAA